MIRALRDRLCGPGLLSRKKALLLKLVIFTNSSRAVSDGRTSIPSLLKSFIQVKPYSSVLDAKMVSFYPPVSKIR